MKSDSTPLCVLQISDTHLFGDAAGELYGVNTRASLGAVMAAARNSGRIPDAILASGDLAHDESPAAYAALAEMLAVFGVPVLCLPGNHDARDALRDSATRYGWQSGGIWQAGGWRLVLLDTLVPHAAHGELAADQLRLLEQAVTQDGAAHLLACLHHHPVPLGSRWLDRIMLKNAAEFFARLDRQPRVRGIVWGHVHQTYDGERRGVRLLAVPSTCAQFLPGSAAFALDKRPPGMRWLNLHADGRIETQVEWAA